MCWLLQWQEVYLRIHYNNIDWWGCFQRLEKSVVQILFESYEWFLGFKTFLVQYILYSQQDFTKYPATYRPKSAVTRFQSCKSAGWSATGAVLSRTGNRCSFHIEDTLDRPRYVRERMLIARTHSQRKFDPWCMCGRPDTVMVRTIGERCQYLRNETNNTNTYTQKTIHLASCSLLSPQSTTHHCWSYYLCHGVVVVKVVVKHFRCLPRRRYHHHHPRNCMPVRI